MELAVGAVNYLAGFLLTQLLLPKLRACAPARVVNVASIGQHPIDVDDLTIERDYSGTRAYGQSKRAGTAAGLRPGRVRGTLAAQLRARRSLLATSRSQRSARLADHVLRGLVGAQPLEPWVAQHAVARPLGEADLRDQLRTGPMHAALAHPTPVER